jgi:PadR family transcriptional regulator PadR
VANRSVDVVQGTLDMLVLKALSWNSMHGHAMLGWLREVTGGELQLDGAALYPALHRLEERGLIDAEWGVSDNNRRAKFYRLTPQGRAAMRAESESWQQYVKLVARIMHAAEQRG